MKKLLFFTACWFILDQGMAQFQHSYGMPTTEVGWSLTDLNRDDERYLIAGYHFEQSLDATLIKTDPVGNQIWSNLYGGDKPDFFTSVRQVLVANPSPNYPTYAVAGVTQSYGFGGADAWFVGTDKNGFPMFSQVYGGKEDDRFHCMNLSRRITADDREGYVMAGETRSYDWAYPGANVYVVKTDLWGNLLRATVIGGRGDQRGYWIEQTRDGGYIIVGTTNYPACSADIGVDLPTQIFVIRLKSDLTMVWNRIIGYPGMLEPMSGHNDVARCVKETEEGFVITGYTNTFGLEKTYDAFLLTLDHGGNFKQLRTYGTPCDNEYGFSLVYSRGADGKPVYTVLANRHDPNATYEGMMFQTDLGLNLLWARDYGAEGTEIALELTTDYASRFAFTGYTTSLGVGSADVYLVETKLDGYSNTGCERKIDLKEVDHRPCITKSAQQVFVDDARRIEIEYREMWYEEGRCELDAAGRKVGLSDDEDASDLFEFYPNPPGEQLTIRFRSEVEPSSIGIYSLEGKKLDREFSKSSPGNWLLGTGQLKSGVYIIKVTMPNGNTVKRKLLVE